MTDLFKTAGINSSDYAYVIDMSKELVYTATQEYVARVNLRMNEAMRLFVSGTTVKGSERYKLPATGLAQETGEGGTGKNRVPSGSWDVAFPLKNYNEMLSINDIDLGYTTPAEYQMYIDGIMSTFDARRQFEILRRLFKNTTDTFVDARLGSLTIQPLANSDGTLYPPVDGSTTEADDNHYSATSYTAAQISDTNNPIATIVDELVEHGVNTTEDLPVITFINSAQARYISNLTNFVPYIPSVIQRGSNTDQVSVPAGTPGRVIGYVTGMNGGSWVSVWNNIPSTYMLGLNLGVEAPLKMRVDERGMFGAGGVEMLPSERNGVITSDSWRMRNGFGVANRLGAYILEVSGDSTYTIPTILGYTL